MPFRTVAAAWIAAILVSANAELFAADQVFRAGAYAMDITPEAFPISVNGGMADRQATAAHDPLHARCLVLDNGETRIAFAICDSCMIPREIFDRAKDLASQKTGIPVDHMLMSATHTHEAPTSTGVFQSDPDEAYRQYLTKRIAEGIVKAHENLEPARVGWGSADDPTQVFNRRWFLKPDLMLENPFGKKIDRVQMNPGNGNPNKTEPSGPVDPEVCVLSVQAQDGRPIALLANYSLHYVGGVPGELLSADYFGAFAERLALRIGATEAEPAFVGIMSNGTSGNINNVDYAAESLPGREPFEQMTVVANSVAEAAYQALEHIEYHDWVPLEMVETEVELGVRLPSAEDVEGAKRILAEAGEPPLKGLPAIYARETVLLAEYPETVKAKVQAIRIGDLGVTTSPCETFVETGLAIKEGSPFKKTFTISLANGYNGYLPTPEHHEYGGYETWRARSSYLAADAEPKIRQTQLDLLQRVAQSR